MLVSLKPIGGEGSVDPSAVTSIETVRVGDEYHVQIWVRGHAGYKNVKVDEEWVRRYLNNPAAYLREKQLEEIASVITSIESALEPDPPVDWQESLSDALDCLRGVYDTLEHS